MRIVGGRLRGLKLAEIGAGDALAHLRPTGDRVREAVFNLLENSLAEKPLPGARVLDLFAGTGALGLEALSRGAAEALLVERDPALARALQDNLRRLEGGERGRVVRADAVGLLAAPLHGRFDVVFVDPPFDAALWQPVLAALGPWLADDAWLYLESPREGRVEPGPGWLAHRQSRSRDAGHALYRRVAVAGSG